MNVPNPVLEELIKTGHLTQEQAEAIRDEHLSQGISASTIAVERRFVTEDVFLDAVARLLGTRRIELPEAPQPQSAVPAGMARLHGMVPVTVDDHRAVFAVSDFPAPAATDDIAFVLSRRIEYVVARKDQIAAALLELYGEADDAPDEMLAMLENDLKQENVDLADPEHAANATPVIRFVNLVLYQAVKDRASDIHFEPFADEFKIRYRVDGALYEMAPPPKQLALPIVSRIKVISGLDIAEARLPQDGRIQLDVAGRSIDFRVSTLPTQFGESVVLRVLDRANVELDINRIGFPDDIRAPFIEDIKKPNGIVIVTGPTGSGKTTTLYAALQHINNLETKILTAEDPVEYDVEGIIQLPIRENIGLTFASALRSFLRQDPDVIMVGEIRDRETAQIAIQASLTGHLVFTTLHTNDAAGAITRLIDMDVEPYLIASTLEAVLAQRLLRTICPECKTAYRPDDTELALLGVSRATIGDRPFFKGTGCEACHGSGYAGRRAIFEYMPIRDGLRAGILERQPSLVLRQQAQNSGMRTLREDGLRCILAAETTVSEVIQYT